LKIKFNKKVLRALPADERKGCAFCAGQKAINAILSLVFRPSIALL
jgi:hypothetical protein